MNPSKDEFDAALAQKLDALKDVPARNPQTAARQRAEFLQQAQSAAGGVSAAPVARHNGWIQTLQSIFRLKKERSPMFGTVATIILIVSLLFGGGGATLAMAQSSLPDQPLYGVKTTVENFRMDLTGNPDGRVELALKFADQRVEEIQRMIQANSVPPESVQARYQQQLEFAIQTALQMQADPAIVALKKVQTRLEKHLQAFEQLGSGANAPCGEVLARVRDMLQERLMWVELGMENPLKLQEQLRQRERMQPSVVPGGANSQTPPGTGGGNPWTTGTPTPGSGYGPGPGECTTCTPQSTGQGGNPWTTGTPTPGSGYGPGPGECTTCTPQSTGQGGNPWTTGTPTPGSGYGAPTDDPGSGGGGGATSQPQPTSAGPGPGGKK